MNAKTRPSIPQYHSITGNISRYMCTVDSTLLCESLQTSRRHRLCEKREENCTFLERIPVIEAHMLLEQCRVQSKSM